MQPYKPLVIDNRPPLPVFLEGSPLTDGMANFAASLFQTPIQAAEIRHQREGEAMADLWKEREFDRQGQQDKLRELWHGEETTRQKGLDAGNEQMRKAQIAHLQSDSARRWMEDLGKAAGSVFGTKGSQAQRAGWSTFVGEDGKPYLYHRGTGQVMPATPSHSKLDANGNPIAGTDVGTTGKAGAAKAVGSFWDMHRSGSPGGAKTLGDVTGLRWYGEGDGGEAPSAAPVAAAPGLDMAEAGHHAQNIADLYQSGDRAAAQNWIQQMRAEHGEEFANAVKEQVRTLVQAQGQQGPAVPAQAP